MSQKRLGDDWWKATDGKWYPPVIMEGGRSYLVDPTGRFGYRAVRDGRWTEHVLAVFSRVRQSDPDGAALLATVVVPVAAPVRERGQA